MSGNDNVSSVQLYECVNIESYMQLKTINVTGWQPGNHAHIMQMLRQKHPGKEIIIQHRFGAEVDYLVGDKTK